MLSRLMNSSRKQTPYSMRAVQESECTMSNDPVKGWYWKLNDNNHEPCLELYDRDSEMLAFIKPRPNYCDRGHYQVVINLPDLEPIDGRDLMHYMDLETAMWETVEFLAWRLHKVTHHNPRGAACITVWAKENMPLGEMEITSIEYRSTVAYTDPTTLNARKAERASRRLYNDKPAEPSERIVTTIYDIGSSDPMTYPPAETVTWEDCLERARKQVEADKTYTYADDQIKGEAAARLAVGYAKERGLEVPEGSFVSTREREETFLDKVYGKSPFDRRVETVEQHKQHVEDEKKRWKADQAQQIRELLSKRYIGCEKSAFLISFLRPDGTSAVVDEHEAKAAGVWEEVQQAMKRMVQIYNREDT